MSKNYNLIKSGVISFKNLLIDKYSFIGLNETEVITLIKLQNLLISPEKTSLEKLPEKMHETMQLGSKEISDCLAKLIESKYIDIEEVDGEVTYSLDLTYQRLANVLDSENEKEDEDRYASDFKKITNIIEKEFNKLVSPLELQLIKSWIYEDKYEFSLINESILDAVKRQRKNVKAVNEILRSKKQRAESKNKKQDTDLTNLFNNVYGKIKG